MLNKYPYIISGYYFQIGPQYGNICKINSEKKKYYTLNHDAIIIVEKCDGTKRLKNIIKEISYESEEGIESLTPVILNYLKNSNFIEFSNTPLSNRLNIIRNKIHVPSHLSVELTNKCNFKCKHCYNQSTSNNSEYWDINDLFKVLNKFKKFGVRTIELTGGEPTLHPKINEIINYCCKHFMKVCLISNGFLLNKMTFPEEFNKTLFFQIDVHGTNEDYVNWFCEKKFALINAIESIEKLIEKNFLIRISMTVTPLNKEQVYSTINLAKKLGVNSIILSTVVPMGRGNNEQLLLNNEDINYLNEMLDKANSKFQNFIFKDPESPFNGNNENILNCGVITNSLTLDSGGNIKMCPMANVNNLNLGNVIKSPIEHILTNELTGLFSKLESPKEKYCKKCEDLEYCNHCVARGLEKFYENPEKCNWMKCSEMRNILNLMKN